jgi:hypothetical protein
MLRKLSSQWVLLDPAFYPKDWLKGHLNPNRKKTKRTNAKSLRRILYKCVIPAMSFSYLLASKPKTM